MKATPTQSPSQQQLDAAVLDKEIQTLKGILSGQIKGPFPLRPPTKITLQMNLDALQQRRQQLQF